jgi:methylthioribose-1-phosphate isomerase
MERQDKGLAFLLQFENVAWYEDGVVRILDRRVYPWEETFVTCKTVDDVSQAITDMVTQSGGPYTAAAMGMALAVDQAKRENKDVSSFCKDAAYKLSHARPTTTERMQIIVNKSAQLIDAALEAGEDPIEAAFNFAIENLNKRYAATRKVAGYLVAHFPDKGVVMTQCFAETILGMMALECERLNKQISFICPETRPYLQGARLTASVLHDQGFEVHVVTDNMPGYIINREKVDVFTSAADVICMDGHIVNKIGTFQIALAANYWGIPYFVTGTPNTKHPTIDTVKIEERNRDLVTTIYGTKVVKDGVEAYYPAFDVTPPYLCSGVVTPKGIFSPYDLGSYQP